MLSSEKSIIGRVVTLKTHPLATNITKIKELSVNVPPLMLVKEVNIDNTEKDTTKSEEFENTQISDSIKYTCVYFNTLKGQFEKKTLFESFLIPVENLNFYRKNEVKKIDDNKPSLKEEFTNYQSDFKYEFGKIVQFKTKKLEHRKSYDDKNKKFKTSSFQTPDFILSGIKKEPQEKLFYPNGERKKIVTEVLYKVMWFNHFQQKFSEEYLPKEFFVEGLEI